jgi:hypothetical protein
MSSAAALVSAVVPSWTGRPAMPNAGWPRRLCTREAAGGAGERRALREEDPGVFAMHLIPVGRFVLA